MRRSGIYVSTTASKSQSSSWNSSCSGCRTNGRWACKRRASEPWWMVTRRKISTTLRRDKSDLQLPRRQSSRHPPPVKIRFPLLCLALVACIALPSCKKAAEGGSTEKSDKNLVEQALGDFEKKNY